MLPGWSVADTLARAAEIEAQLRPDLAGFLAQMFGKPTCPVVGPADGPDRHRVIVNALTRMLLHARQMEFDSNEGLDST